MIKENLFHLFCITFIFTQTHQQMANGEGGDASFLFPRICTPKDTSFLPSSLIMPRIIDGVEVTPGEMPWMVKLSLYQDINSNPSGCAGFLINWRWVMTAGHCLENMQMATISAGRTNYTAESPAEVVFNVTSDNFFIHPQYSLLNNDIGLIKLTQPLVNSSTINPICVLDDGFCQELPQVGSDDESNCGMVFAAGWGNTGNEIDSKVLNKINMTIVDPMQCNRELSGAARVGQKQICAVGDQFISQHHGPLYRDTCLGDSGGPLTCQLGNSMVAVGIVSYGVGCGTGRPGVYTRICSYKDWILETMNIIGCRVPSVPNASFQRLSSSSSRSATTLYAGSFVSAQTSISITCNRNFSPLVTRGKDVSSTCHRNGQWLPGFAECVPNRVRCGSMPDVSNGRAETSSWSLNSVAMISCNNGFRLEGENFIRCLSNSQWSAPNGRCVPILSPLTSMCGPVQNIANGNISQGGNVVGSTRDVVCFPNYQLVGYSRIFCQPNGDWSEPGRCEQGKNHHTITSL